MISPNNARRLVELLYFAPFVYIYIYIYIYITFQFLKKRKTFQYIVT